MNKYEIGELQEIIHEQDPNAFVTFFVGPLIHGGFEKGYEIEGNRIEQMKRGTLCNFGTCSGCD